MKTKPILILVDFQNGFLTEDMKPTADRIQELLKEDAFETVIATTYINEPGSPCASIGHWHEIYENDIKGRELIGNANDFAHRVYYKSTYTAIIPTVEKYLLKNKVDTVFIAGFNTDCCVLKTALDLFDLNIRPIVLERYCDSSMGLQAHSMAIEILKPVIGDHNVYEEDLYFGARQTLEDLIIPELRAYKIGLPLVINPTEHKIINLMDTVDLNKGCLNSIEGAMVVGIYQSYVTLLADLDEQTPSQFNIQLSSITSVNGIKVDTLDSDNIIYEYIADVQPTY